MTKLIPSQPKHTRLLAGVEDICCALYGPPGVGKSTFVAKCPDAIALAPDFEGYQSLQDWIALANPAPMTAYWQGTRKAGWEWFQLALRELFEMKKAGRCPYRLVVIDTGALLEQFATDWFMADNQLEELPEDFGKTYTKIAQLLIRAFRSIRANGFGLLLVCHEKIREKKGKIEKILQTTPKLRGQIMEDVTGWFQVVAYFGYRVDPKSQEVERTIDFHGHVNLLAKDRTRNLPKEALLTTDIPDVSDFNLFAAAFAKAPPLPPGSTSPQADEAEQPAAPAVPKGRLARLRERQVKQPSTAGSK